MSVYIEHQNFAGAYDVLLKTVMEDPDYVCSPRGMEVRELVAPSIRVIDPSDRLYSSPARQTPMKYLTGEFLWYFSGRRDVEFISKFSSFWRNITNVKNGGHSPTTGYLLEHDQVNSSYGHLTMCVKDACWDGKQVSQWEWALETLVRDPDSRQAVMHVNRPGHQCEWVKDFPCTMSLQFLLRDGELNLVVNMRSNDLIKGLTFDFPMFSCMQETFCHNLSSLTGESIALGHLTLSAGSSHVYERDYGLVNSMIGRLSSMTGPLPMGVPPVNYFRTSDGSLVSECSPVFDNLMAVASGDNHPECLSDAPFYAMLGDSL